MNMSKSAENNLIKELEKDTIENVFPLYIMKYERNNAWVRLQVEREEAVLSAMRFDHPSDPEKWTIVRGDPKGFPSFWEEIKEQKSFSVQASLRKAFKGLSSFKETEFLLMRLTKESRKKTNAENAVCLEKKHLKELIQRFAGFDYSLGQSLERGQVYGITRKNKIISCAGVMFSIPEAAHIGYVWTDEARRGKGLAYAATSTLVDSLLEKFESITLYVAAANAPALHLYQKLGFVKYATHYLEEVISDPKNRT